jgi:hypothetical protein
MHNDIAGGPGTASEFEPPMIISQALHPPNTTIQHTRFVTQLLSLIQTEKPILLAD